MFKDNDPSDPIDRSAQETPVQMIFGFVLLLVFFWFMGKVVGAY